MQATGGEDGGGGGGGVYRTCTCVYVCVWGGGGGYDGILVFSRLIWKKLGWKHPREL